MLVIDGSYGEGGGQILRTAVALSCVSGTPVKIINIRAKRPKPGLKKQHITSIMAAARLCRAEVEGVELGSREVIFRPGSIAGGNHFFNVGTAGSVTLVLQTISPIMAYSPTPVKVVIRGGTDVPWSPPIDYFINVFTPYLRMMGYELSIKLVRRGHYPRGGGEVIAEVRSPPRELESLRIARRGSVKRIEGISHCVRLPKHVAERQARSAERRLRELGIREPISIRLEFYESSKDPHLCPGSGIVLWALADPSIIGADALGAKGKRAEIVGREAAEKLFKDLSTNAALDRHMSDNILIYAALAKGTSTLSGAELTMHAHTVMWLLKKVLKVNMRVEGRVGEPFKIMIDGAGIKA